MNRFVRGVSRLGVAACMAATTARAQNVLLPLDDIAYTYIDALQARGAFRALPTVERPYSVGAIRAAVDEARAATGDQRTRRWLDAIDAAASKYAPGITSADSGMFAASLAGYGVAQTSGPRDLMQSDRVNTVAPGFTVRAVMLSGPFAAAMRVIADRRLRVDPEFLGRKDRVLSARTEDGYLGFTSRFATLQLGRTGRSWALPGQLGLMVGNAAYSYDHAYLRIGTDRIHLSSIVTRLDDEPLNFTTDTMAQRFFSAHRLALRFADIEAGISESIVYGGVARGFQPNLLNPVSPAFVTQYSDGDPINVAFGADALWRSRSGVTLGGQIYLDDFQIDRCDLCGEPPGIGLTFTGDGLPLAGASRAFASYTRVTSLTYRAPDRFESYTSRYVGLGQRNSDFDEVKLGVDVGPILPAPVRVYLAYRRQGEGDYREPYPTIAQRDTWPTIFEGVVVKTFRVAASTAFRVGSSTEIAADGGINRTANDLRVTGATRTRFEGRIRVALEPSWARITKSLF